MPDERVIAMEQAQQRRNGWLAWAKATDYRPMRPEEPIARERCNNNRHPNDERHEQACNLPMGGRMADHYLSCTCRYPEQPPVIEPVEARIKITGATLEEAQTIWDAVRAMIAPEHAVDLKECERCGVISKYGHMHGKPCFDPDATKAPDFAAWIGNRADDLPDDPYLAARVGWDAALRSKADSSDALADEALRYYARLYQVGMGIRDFGDDSSVDFTKGDAATASDVLRRCSIALRSRADEWKRRCKAAEDAFIALGAKINALKKPPNEAWSAISIERNAAANGAIDEVLAILGWSEA